MPKPNERSYQAIEARLQALSTEKASLERRLKLADKEITRLNKKIETLKQAAKRLMGALA